MAITIINSIESLIAPFLKCEAISIVDIKSILLAGNVSFVTKDGILEQLLFSIESYCLMLIDLIEKRSNYQDKSDLLSLQHHKIIYCSIEILWQLGIKTLFKNMQISSLKIICFQNQSVHWKSISKFLKYWIQI
jgi:hypothetical protein